MQFIIFFRQRMNLLRFVNSSRISRLTNDAKFYYLLFTIHQLYADTGCCLEDLPRAVANRKKIKRERESNESVLSARFDDDDDNVFTSFVAFLSLYTSSASQLQWGSSECTPAKTKKQKEKNMRISLSKRKQYNEQIDNTLKIYRHWL